MSLSRSTDTDDPLSGIVALLRRLPGVGEKSARRMAYTILSAEPPFAQTLGDAIAQLPQRIQRCERCGVFATSTTCAICNDAKRTDGLLCVVARPWDVDAFEKAGFRGRYHVLHTLLDPLGGVGPEVFPLQQLIDHVREQSIHEVILATPTTVEGEATSLFVAEGLRPLGVTLSRIASGVPHGGDIEYADAVTLGRALDGRRGL